jgi:hypothetical protein
MMRRSVRTLLAGGLAIVAVVSAAAPALAKCGHGVPCPDPARLRVTVDGPGLVEPIVIRGEDAWTMVNITGVNYRPYAIHDGEPAVTGPRYEAVYEFRGDERLLFLRQDIYPYANGRTYAFTPEGQWYVSHFADMSPSGELFIPQQEAGHGWRSSRTLQSILREHGLPEDAPVTAAPDTRAVAASAGETNAPWWIGGALLLGAIVAVSALRRRSG